MQTVYGSGYGYTVNYTANAIAGGAFRAGRLTLTTDLAGNVNYTDEYTDVTGNVGLTLTPAFSGFNNTLQVGYTATTPVTFNYSVDSIQNTN
jgi:hypothetical protein